MYMYVLCMYVNIYIYTYAPIAVSMNCRCLDNRARLFGVCIWAPDFWKLPDRECLISGRNGTGIVG